LRFNFGKAAWRHRIAPENVTIGIRTGINASNLAEDRHIAITSASNRLVGYTKEYVPREGAVRHHRRHFDTSTGTDRASKHHCRSLGNTDGVAGVAAQHHSLGAHVIANAVFAQLKRSFIGIPRQLSSTRLDTSSKIKLDCLEVRPLT
jgi:hypothetical protein